LRQLWRFGASIFQFATINLGVMFDESHLLVDAAQRQRAVPLGEEFGLRQAPLSGVSHKGFNGVSMLR
jgi:hypothetical protein